MCIRDSANKPAFDWNGYVAPKPGFTGAQVLDDIDLNVLAEYIDWTPFFISWDLAGKYPRILTDEVVGEAATSPVSYTHLDVYKRQG